MNNLLVRNDIGGKMRIEKKYVAGKTLDPVKLEQGRESFPSTPTNPLVNTRYNFDFSAFAVKVGELELEQNNAVQP